MYSTWQAVNAGSWVFDSLILTRVSERPFSPAELVTPLTHEHAHMDVNMNTDTNMKTHSTP
jgi:hypothetical protein